VAAAHADGHIFVSTLKDDDQLEALHEWKETRFKLDQSYIGLSVSDGCVLCFPARDNR
jgi:ribosome biogenesis protein NSA1